jgi:hypothetical protein
VIVIAMVALALDSSRLRMGPKDATAEVITGAVRSTTKVCAEVPDRVLKLFVQYAEIG